MHGVGSRLGDIGHVAGDDDRGVGVLPLGRALPRVDDGEAVRDLTRRRVENVDGAVSAEDVREVIRAAHDVAERVFHALGKFDDLKRLGFGVDESHRAEQVPLGVDVALVVADDDRAGFADVGVAHTTVRLVGGIELRDRAVVVDECAVLAAEHDGLVLRGAFAVHTGALIRRGDLAAGGVVRHDAVPAVGVADGGEERAVLEHDRDAVVGFDAFDDLDLGEAIGARQICGVEDRGVARTVGVQHRLVSVPHDVTGSVGLEDRVGELGVIG